MKPGFLAMAARAQGGAPAFTPLSIAGLTSWFRADLGMTLSGADVTTWDDQSAAGILPTLTPLLASPQYVASGINGNPDLNYTAASTQSLKGSTTVLGTTAVALFGIFKSSGIGIYLLWGMQYNFYHHAVFMNYSGANAGKLSLLDGSGVEIQSPATYNNGAPHVFVGTYTSVGGAMALYVDDGASPVVTGTGSGAIANAALDKNAVGGSTGAAASDRYFNGSIPEVGSYNVVPSGPDIISLVNYLKTRAGI